MNKNIVSGEKGKVKELHKVKDEPPSQTSAESGEGNLSHGEDMEDPVGGDCSSVPRRPSQILPDNSPVLGSRVFPYRTWSSSRLSPRIKLNSHHCNIGDDKVMEKETVIWRSKPLAASLPDMRLKEFTPDITADGSDDETYLFQCSSAGLYQCSVTGLVFVMKAEGDVVYRTVPWYRRLLDQHHKKPAGPLFDIRCEQQSLCQLHLPHCELISTGGGQFMQVAHVDKLEGIDFIPPRQITESHVVINITEFSGYGNVRDENSPCEPVRALVLLFYKPPVDPDLTSFLSVLLLPKNVVLQDVLHTRKKLYGDERYIETSPHCKLHPNQLYTLSVVPEDDSVLVQPIKAEFHEESYDNYFLSFQVILLKVMKMIRLNVSDSTSSNSVWNRAVYLSSSGVKKCRESVPLNLSPNEKLLNVRSCFIDGISAPVLNSLLDKLLEKKVITDAEREEADVMQNRRGRARCVIDTVRKKGEAASLQMIELLCDLDSYFCKSLGLI